MNIDKVRPYLFIAYEMYVKGQSKEYLDNELSGFALLAEMDSFNSWLNEILK